MADFLVMKAKSDKSGYVIFLVVILLFVLSTYTLTIIGMSCSRSLHVIRKFRKLKASVCAYSGLSLAQAFAAGYDGHDIHSEVDTLRKKIDDIGTIIISSKHDAGWLKVTSTGIHLKDTVCIEGILGQLPPRFTNNVLNVFDTKSNLVVADRARVYGNVGTNGKGVVTKGSGIFSGKITSLGNVKYDNMSIDNEFENAYNLFKERKAINFVPDSLLPIETERFKEAVSKKRGDIFLEGNLIINEDFNLDKRVLWINGNLFIKDKAEIRNIKAYVTGNTYISKNAFLELGSIFCFGDVRIVDRACIRLNIACAETLMVSGYANVEYPSVLYLSPFLQQKTGKSGLVLLIEENAHVTGTILVGAFNKSSLQPRVYVSGRSCIEGFLFSPSPVTINGKISGNVSVNKMIYKKPGCVYDGWLMEVTLIHRDLSEMIIPLVFPDNCYPWYLYVTKQVNDKTI